MSNPVVMMAHARGLGALGLNFPDGGIFGGGGQDTYNSGGGGGGWYNEWGGSLINQAGSILTNIFGNRNQQPVYQPPPVTYGTNPYDNVPPPAGGVGFGLDSQGIRLSDGSHIGWTPIALGVGVLFLLQSPGFSRKRNPKRSRNPKRRSRRRSRR